MAYYVCLFRAYSHLYCTFFPLLSHFSLSSISKYIQSWTLVLTLMSLIILSKAHFLLDFSGRAPGKYITWIWAFWRQFAAPFKFKKQFLLAAKLLVHIFFFKYLGCVTPFSSGLSLKSRNFTRLCLGVDHLGTVCSSIQWPLSASSPKLFFFNFRKVSLNIVLGIWTGPFLFFHF